jgi:hypothetical protein
VSWRKITCQERDALKGARELAPFASRTDMGGEFGDPSMFIEWGDNATDTPVLRDYRYPAPIPMPPLANVAPRPDTKPCEHYAYEEEQ